MAEKVEKLIQQISIISQDTFADEAQMVNNLLGNITLSNKQLDNIQNDAAKYADIIRKAKHYSVENFIKEYSLSTEEGVAVMCLAEALLRIPDKETASALIEDKLRNKNWGQHLGKSDSTFVNASSWGLFLTGKIVSFSSSNFSLARLIGKLGEPLLLSAVKKAIEFISGEFIMGDSIASGRENAVNYEKKGYRISYDILGESSRNAAQADFYYYEYLKAVKEISKSVVPGAGIYEQPSISVKLSALHPRFELLQITRVKDELLPRILDIVKLCADSNIAISFDAEEATRLDIYLHVLTMLLAHEDLHDYHGIGFVVQAYQKRALNVLDYIIKLADAFSKKIPVRLVKGAYWDSEIKNAQEQGLIDYPVYTVKEYTDVSYLACAEKMFTYDHAIAPQFATHNAYTIAAIKEISKGRAFEFQRLHGMGAALHNEIVANGGNSRIYSPVGQYKDLLAYLMRRLLENGANTSFVSMIKNKDLALTQILAHPTVVAKQKLKETAKLNKPLDIFNGKRQSSQGYDMGVSIDVERIQEALHTHANDSYDISSLINGQDTSKKPSQHKILQPASLKEMAVFDKATPEQIANALDIASKAFDSWSATAVEQRAKILEKFANLLHDKSNFFYSLLMREAGKNIKDSIAEVREAIDFARYYAVRIRELAGQPLQLPGYTGEDNTLNMHGKGVFVCISPWNFPLAIFVGQILAALVTGNTVIAKPADPTPVVAYEAVKLMFEAGIPGNALQLLISSGKDIGSILLTDNRVSGVCFTGSTAVARIINRTLAARDCPIATFIAETGGQNAMIIDSSALLEQATDSIVHSAFGSIGQRCSALRVLYIQEDIYEPLINMVAGAMQEQKIGNPEKLQYDLGPIISAGAKAELERHINDMKQKGFKIRAIHKASDSLAKASGHYLAPHIIEVNSISDIAQENFGPILHVRPYKTQDLDLIIKEINSTGYGLTFGFHSRIESKIHEIASKIKAGNIYINRTTIGAQVESHPFGGEGNSGTGFKAGGPNYLLKFMIERTITINSTAIGGNVKLLSDIMG